MNINRVSALNHRKFLSVNKINELDLPFQTQSLKGFLMNTDDFPKPKMNSPGTFLYSCILREGTHQTESPFRTQCPSANYLKLRCFPQSIYQTK